MQCIFNGKEIWHKNSHNIDELSADLGFPCSEKYPSQQVSLSSVNQHLNRDLYATLQSRSHELTLM
jgi:hypothetical protein